ncbi:uncharacterized protein LOC133190062 [Saccostrea echinata]|uniref:uncharacterized protein LOC133190062 n=1 Tax=Saccostrea echinata TaxID=191078 RepID=UPI002A823C4A|nr:uncharacterized protein LOC133190062 [Saccostrea echinata]
MRMTIFGVFILALVFTFDNALGEKYRIFSPGFFKISWEQARRNCQNIGIGWDLVKIESRAEDQIIKDMLKCETGRGDGWFIGGISRNGKWTYPDGSRMIYTAFGIKGRDTQSIAARKQFIGDVINYAAIFKSDLAWDYLTQHDNNIMGYVCEAWYC